MLHLRYDEQLYYIKDQQVNLFSNKNKYIPLLSMGPWMTNELSMDRFFVIEDMTVLYQIFGLAVSSCMLF
jgi:hypothetical protein